MAHRRPCRAGRTSRTRPRWVAVVRLPGRQSDRAAAGGARQRRAHRLAPLVLHDSGDRRAARPGARHRAAQPGSACPAPKTPYAGPAAARSRAEDPARRGPPGGDGILAARRDSVRVARRRRHGRAGARPGRRGRVVGRPGPAVRGALERRGDRLAQARRPNGSTASRIGPSRPPHSRMRDGVADDRVRLAAVDVAMVRRGRADQRLGAQCLGAGKRRQSALPAHAPSTIGRIGRNELLLLDLWGKLPDARRGLC